MATLEERVARAAAELDNYESTVQAIAAFRQFLVGPDAYEVRFNVGRRMETSPTNAIQPNVTVTPDIVAQLHEGYGMAVEVKRSMPSEKTRWLKTLQQVRKYDDDLNGWWTDPGHIEDWNAALLVHADYSRPVVRALREQPVLQGPKSVVIEFAREDAAKPVIRFRLEEGSLSEARLLTLVDGSKVPLKVIVSPLAFYDGKPPLIYMATKVWDWAYSERFDGGYRDEAIKRWVVPIDVERLVDEMRKAYGSGQFDSDERSCEFPKTKWVTTTLGRFVDHRLARRTEEGGYEVLISEPPHGDTTSYLVKTLSIGVTGDERESDAQQVSLLDLIEEDD